MRIVVHDYAGHPFQVQLSRELAARGHDVLHLYCPSHASGRGAVAARAGDPPTFAVEAVDLGADFAKYALIERFRHERRYGRLAAARVERFRPDVVLSANTPVLAQRALLAAARRTGTRFVYWQQDVFAVAFESIARQRLPVVGGALGRALGRLEGAVLRGSDHVVVISDDFVPVLQRWGIAPDAVTVVENWAPLDELATTPASGGWAAAHGLAGRTTLLYSGTLGLKHNPGLLLALARSFGDRDDVRVVVVSEGRGADWLREQVASEPAPALVQLPYQPYDVLPEVMASAAVLIAILEPDAGVFSVPSKVLSYHCAGRPILGAIPAQNLAARIIERAGSGVVVAPTDEQAFVRQATALLDDRAGRLVMGRRARAYADDTFDIAAIADRFEAVLTDRAQRALVTSTST